MDIHRILFEIIALVSFFALCYIYFHQDEIVGVAVTNYLETHDFTPIK